MNNSFVRIQKNAILKTTQTEDVDHYNFLYMSRFMHEPFDGINMIVTETPSFAVVYKSHDDGVRIEALFRLSRMP